MRDSVLREATIGILLSACALLARFAFDPFLQDTQPYATLYPTVAIASALVGARGGIVVLATGVLWADFFFVDRRGELTAWDEVTAIRAVSFVIAACIIIVLAHRARRATDNADRLTKRLLEAYRQKDRFLSILSHEIRNPFNAIAISAKILDLRVPKDSDLRGAIDIQGRQLTQLNKLLDDLLDVARISRGRIELKREVADVRRCVQDAVDEHMVAMGNKRQALDVTMPPDPVLAYVDTVRVIQIVSNLLQNASKYSPGGTRIDVTVRVENANVVVSVSDQGQGIAPDVLPAIFEAYYVGDVSDVSKHGLGLGLWLCNRLATLHGGEMRAFSDGPGKGARFELSLPVQTASEIA
jgi:signal transduction histidine kinase